jgi:hypothetical protein
MMFVIALRKNETPDNNTVEDKDDDDATAIMDGQDGIFGAEHGDIGSDEDVGDADENIVAGNDDDDDPAERELPAVQAVKRKL